MPIAFTCPHCRTTMQVREEFAGQTGPCAVCAKTITIPVIAVVAGKAPPSPSAGAGRDWPAPAPLPPAAATSSPAVPPGTASASAEPTSGLISIGAGLGILAAVLAAMTITVLLSVPLLALARPLVAVALGATHRAGCEANLRRIGVAMQAYHQQYGAFPPAYVADAQGRPMHSWRVLILPFLGPREKALHAHYDFNEPWDGANNLRLADRAPDVFRCPADGKIGASEMSYRVIVGPRTCFPGATATRLADVVDGPSETLLVVEAYNETAIAWTQPVDLDARTLQLAINRGGGEEMGGHHRGGIHVLTADGRVHFLPETAPPQVLRAAISRDAGDVPPPGYLDAPLDGP